MKQSLLLTLCIIVFIACNEAPASVKETDKPTTAFDESKEQAAIMAVIEKETASFFARDYEGWKSTRSQKPYDFQAWNNDDGTFDVENGWQDVDPFIGKYIKDDKAPIGRRPEVIRRDLQCKFFGPDCAYLTWSEYVQKDTTTSYHRTKDLRVMEKQNGEWKIVAVASYWNYKNLLKKDSIQ